MAATVAQIARELTRKVDGERYPLHLAREQAKEIRQTRPLPSKRPCSRCNEVEDELVPTFFDLCKACTLKAIETGTGTLVRPRLWDAVCQFCGDNVHRYYVVSAYVCKPCLTKIGKWDSKGKFNYKK